MMVLVMTPVSRMDEMASLVVGEREAVQDIMKSKDEKIRKLKRYTGEAGNRLELCGADQGQDGGKDI
jgi:hypothetical protein